MAPYAKLIAGPGVARLIVTQGGKSHSKGRPQLQFRSPSRGSHVRKPRCPPRSFEQRTDKHHLYVSGWRTQVSVTALLSDDADRGPSREQRECVAYQSLHIEPAPSAERHPRSIVFNDSKPWHRVGHAVPQQCPRTDRPPAGGTPPDQPSDHSKRRHPRERAQCF